MEEIFFLRVDEEGWAVLRRIERSTARHLVLVVSASPERLRLSMLLRLIRRHVAAHAKQLRVVSEDPQIRLLAERIGCSAAATLDEHCGLMPGRISAPSKPAWQRGSQLALSSPLSSHSLASSSVTRLTLEAGSTVLPTQSEHIESSSTCGHDQLPHQQQTQRILSSGDPPRTAQGSAGKPHANLETILRDGHLPNPAAMRGLDEDAEHAEPEEIERLHYEIADESYLSQAQKEAEEHEARIIDQIRKTSTSGIPTSPFAPSPAKDTHPSSGKGQKVPPDDYSDKPPLASPQANIPTTAPETTPRLASQANEQEGNLASTERMPDLQRGRLRPMRTIDDLLHERGQTELFEWFAAGAAHLAPEKPDGQPQLSSPPVDTDASAPQATKAGATAPHQSHLICLLRRNRKSAQQEQQPGTSTLPTAKPPSLKPLRRPSRRHISLAAALALSLSMTCLGFAMIPAAQVSYHVERLPYSEVILLDAQPASKGKQGSAIAGALVDAEVAHFDGVLIAQIYASGHRNSPEHPDQSLAVPTQSDVDQAASLLRTQLEQLGQAALRAQAQPEDLLGPPIEDGQIEVRPAVGTVLPMGITTFQVSLALHLRATLVRKQVLLQTIRHSLNQDISKTHHGFVLEPGQPPLWHLIKSEPAGAGEAMLELQIQVQASGFMVPALTPAQARAAIAGMSVKSAEAYLRRQPGISHITIMVQPKWLNRLPIFPARIRINLES